MLYPRPPSEVACALQQPPRLGDLNCRAPVFLLGAAFPRRGGCLEQGRLEVPGEFAVRSDGGSRARSFASLALSWLL